MTNQINSAVIEKIRKCLALSHGNASQGEMEAAMGKAKELAMKHGIELASIDMAAGRSAGSSIEIDRADVQIKTSAQKPYHTWIYRVLRQCFGVQVIISGTEAIFIGEATDVAICRELFPYLEKVFPSTYYHAEKNGMVSCAANKNGVFRGLCDGIIEVNKREEAKLTPKEASCWALIVVNKDALIEKRVEKEFPVLIYRKARAQQVSNSAYAFGRAKGQQIRLNQVGSGKANGRIGQ